MFVHVNGLVAIRFCQTLHLVVITTFKFTLMCWKLGSLLLPKLDLNLFSIEFRWEELHNCLSEIIIFPVIPPSLIFIFLYDYSWCSIRCTWVQSHILEFENYGAQVAIYIKIKLLKFKIAMSF